MANLGQFLPIKNRFWNIRVILRVRQTQHQNPKFGHKIFWKPAKKKGAMVNQHPPVHQLGWMDGWMDGFSFSIHVPFQVEFFCLSFLSPGSQFFFFGNFIFSPPLTQLPFFFQILKHFLINLKCATFIPTAYPFPPSSPPPLSIYLSIYLPFHLPTYQHFK